MGEVIDVSGDVVAVFRDGGIERGEIGQGIVHRRLGGGDEIVHGNAFEMESPACRTILTTWPEASVSNAGRWG